MFYSRHYSPYDVPHGPGADHGAFEDGQDDQLYTQPEGDEGPSFDGPLESVCIDQPEEGRVPPALPTQPGLRPTSSAANTDPRFEPDTGIKDAVPRTPEQDLPVSAVVSYPHVEREYGIPLDRIRDGMGDATRIIGMTPGGSGASIRYQLDRDAGSRPDEAGQAYIEVEDLGSGANMSAQTERGGEAVRFNISAECENQRAPDMDPERFVAWTLDTFRQWGSPPRYIVELLVPGSANHQQFEEAVASTRGTETTIEEAVRLTDFGRIYGQNGFTEIDTITTKPNSDGDHIHIQFARPGAVRNTSQIPHDEVEQADPLIPHPSDGAQAPQEPTPSLEEHAEAYWAEVEVYLEEERPIAKKGAFTINTNRHWTHGLY